MTRRQLIKRNVAVVSALAGSGLSAAWSQKPGPKHLLLMLSTADMLAEESCAGFKSVLPADCCRTSLPPPRCGKQVMVLPSVRAFSRAYIRPLRVLMDQGAWVIWERAAGFETTVAADELLGNALGIAIRRCVRVKSNEYVHYRWPATAMVRAFHQVSLLNCSADEMVAEYDGVPVAMKRAYGNGGLILLGSMLGPGIRAGEPQALQVVQALFRPSNL